MESIQTGSKVDYAMLLKHAVEKPGQLSQAYGMFHQYSFGNMLAAMMQCNGREIEFGPMASFNGWKRLGRSVKAGSKALCLLHPRIIFVDVDDGKGNVTKKQLTRFVYKATTFVFGQTDGKAIEIEAPNAFNIFAVADAFGIEIEPWSYHNPNAMGVAFPSKRKVQINPMNPDKFGTFIHEVGHVLLHADQDIMVDEGVVTRNLKELEAEGVRYCVKAACGETDLSAERGYIQHWHGKDAIPETQARRIINTTNKVLVAGFGLD